MKYSPDEAKVIRDGRALKVPASDVVPGDIVLISVGNRIPADCRLLSISSGSFRIDQALLTGESESVSKICDAVEDAGAVKQDMVNMLFSVRSSPLASPLIPRYRERPSSTVPPRHSSPRLEPSLPSATYTSPSHPRSPRRPL